MPPAKRRKTRATAAAEKADIPASTEESKSEALLEPEVETISTTNDVLPPPQESTTTDTTTTAPTPADTAARAKERQERFRALQARAKTSSAKNMKEAALESQRLATDPNLLTSINRKHATASQKLLKADVEAGGEDFERKRAWDWTVEESERWDKRVKKKEAHRDDQAFQDYRQDSRKVYKRQIGNLKPDMEGYEKEKMAAVERAAASGNLEIVETEDGELVAVDKDGSFYSTADSTGFVENKPDRAAVDRLVADLQQAEDTRLRKRKERGQDKEEGDVTYINEKNKNFNQKLNRFYNKVRRTISLPLSYG
jgi:pre-mRNA-splicing factor SYF2